MGLISAVLERRVVLMISEILGSPSGGPLAKSSNRDILQPAFLGKNFG